MSVYPYLGTFPDMSSYSWEREKEAPDLSGKVEPEGGTRHFGKADSSLGEPTIRER
jgi:hypothetical protein